MNRILGRGGMGVVWHARDETLAEDIALKFLPDAVRWDPSAFEDLKAETRRARQLTHPNIIRIHDFVEDAAGAAISMELVGGRTLTALRCERPEHVLSPDEILAWLPQLCAALDYAHREARIVHRDLKPTNVMVTAAGAVKVGDFGIARSLADSITRVSMMSAGTLVYMSPQQAMGEEPGAADDIYSLGATLYELLAGKPPFHTGDVRVQLFQRKPDKINARRAALAAERGGTVPAVPDHWEETIAACLAKEPADRPASAGEVLARLTRTANGKRRVLRWRLPSLTQRRARLAAGIAAALLAVGGGWLAVSAWRSWYALEAAVGAYSSDATRAIGAWNMDGDGRDASGHGLDAQIGGTIPSRDRFGRIDRALHFNGNAGIVVPDAPVLRWSGRDSFSAAIWVLPARAGLNVDVWRSTPDAVDALQWAIGLQNDVPIASIGRLQNDQLTNLHGAAPIDPRAWHHLALVVDRGEADLFVDGKPAVRSKLGPNRDATLPAHVDMRIGRPLRLATDAFFGELDDARLWRRALRPAEIAQLAERAAPPRFALTRGGYGDKDDLTKAAQVEFGPDARVADWQDLRRWHGDDARGWVSELGILIGETNAWVLRAGEPRFDPQRHYFITRFDGVKPAYYTSHDELGGMTLALGSWYGGGIPVLVALPAATTLVEKLGTAGTGVRHDWPDEVRAVAVELAWRTSLAPTDAAGVAATLQLRNARRLRVVCKPAGETLALTMGDDLQPQRMRQVQASYGDIEFTLVMREGRLRFRAQSATGALPLCDESVELEGFAVRQLARLDIQCEGWSRESALARATMAIEQ